MRESVFRGYDQAALDIQYSPRTGVPEFQSIVDRWAAASERATQDQKSTLDVAYGAMPGETLDIFHARRAKAPVQIFFHGGYWRSMDKKFFRFMAPPFAARDVTFVIPNYDLCPGVTMDEIVRQCRAAIAWTWKNAASVGGDPARVYISGHSAGGHIIAMALATDWPAAFGIPADAIKGAVGISGLYDLEAIRRTFLNADLRMDKDQAARLSPMRHLPARQTPLIMAVGAKESDEFRRQTSDYVAAWRAKRFRCEHVEVPGHHHYDILHAFMDPAHAFGAAVLRQMGV